MGMGGGVGLGYRANAVNPASAPFDFPAGRLSPDEEIKLLQNQAEVLKNQLEEINLRIKALEQEQNK
jgi:hypothetical protein